jgi:hypothetical protein
VAYNIESENNQIKLLTEYERVIQKDLFGKAVYTALMSGRKYGTISQNGEYSSESYSRTLVFQYLTSQGRRAC